MRGPHHAKSTPQSAPASATRALSRNDRRTRRARLQPSAARTAVSRRRTEARANMRLATLAQAMRNHEEHRAEEHEQRRTQSAAEFFAEGHEVGAVAGVGRGILLFDLGGDDIHLGARLIGRDAIADAADRAELMDGAGRARLLGESNGNDQIALAGEGGSGSARGARRRRGNRCR